jgi:tetratricopeptide (TPR) repeat protein
MGEKCEFVSQSLSLFLNSVALKFFHVDANHLKEGVSDHHLSGGLLCSKLNPGGFQNAQTKIARLMAWLHCGEQIFYWEEPPPPMIGSAHKFWHISLMERLTVGSFVAFGRSGEEAVEVHGQHSGAALDALQQELEGEYRKGIAALQQQDYSTARDILQNLSIHPAVSSAKQSKKDSKFEFLKYMTLKNLAQACLFDGFQDNALSCFIQAAQIFPNREIMLWHKIGTIALDKHNLKLARVAFETGLKFSGMDDWVFIDRLVDVLYLIRDFLSLKELLMKALKLDSLYPKGVALAKKLRMGGFLKDLNESDLIMLDKLDSMSEDIVSEDAERIESLLEPDERINVKIPSECFDDINTVLKFLIDIRKSWEKERRPLSNLNNRWCRRIKFQFDEKKLEQTSESNQMHDTISLPIRSSPEMDEPASKRRKLSNVSSRYCL